MFGKEFQRKFALTERGVHNTKMGTLWTVIVNLVVMGGMGILYLMMNGFIGTLTEGKPLPGVLTILLLVLGFLILSFFTHLQQYKSTYGLVYREVKNVRISLAERLRKLPLGYFGKRDLADLTETIMGDVNRLEHVWSHCLGYLYGSYISTAIIAVMLFAYNWQLAIACLWGVPVAFLLLFGSRKMSARNSEITKAAAVQVSDGIQETLENIREIRATNQEDRFLKALNEKIDHHESRMIHTELTNGIFVNAASVIMRLGVATTILAGTGMILSGEISFMVLFMFLLVITRVYAPFDQALALIAEMFLSQVSADRLMEIHDAKTAEGSESFSPEGHDIVFENVGFAYNVNSGEAGREGPLGGDNEQVLKGVSFTAKEGEVTALVGPSGSGKSTCARLAARLWDIDSGTIRVGGVNRTTLWFFRMWYCSTIRSWKTSVWENTAQRMKKSVLRRRQRTATNLWRSCRRAMIRPLGRTEPGSPEANASGSLLPVHCSKTHRSSFWMRQQPRLMWRTRPKCRALCRVF